jgi:hypothetical protein
MIVHPFHEYAYLLGAVLYNQVPDLAVGNVRPENGLSI